MLIEDLYRAPWHERMVAKIKKLVQDSMTFEEYIALQVEEWLVNPERETMIQGEKYYLNETAILEKTQEFDWKSNQQLSHAFARKLVDQKIGYLLAKQPTISTENKTYNDILQEFFDRGMTRKIKNVGKEAINKGIAYLYPFIDEEGDLKFKKFKSEQIIPFWADSEHMEVMAFLRVYTEYAYINRQKQEQIKVEYYHPGGIKYYLFENGELIADVPAGIEQNYHFTIDDSPHVWDKVPLIHFKYNEEEQPLLALIKSLIDNYNLQASTNADLLADIPKFIYKLINYNGEDLGEFIGNLNKYKAVSLDEKGDVDKLQADIQTEAIEKEIDRNRNAIYEFGRGVDTRDVNLRDASGVALKFRYSDLDMDCNVLETEMLSSLEHLLWFVSHYLNMTGQGDFTDETVNIILNRDMIIAETEVIENAEKSAGILDDKTIRENHPWYTDEVEERLEEQRQAELAEYTEMFPSNRADVTDDEE